MIFSTSEPHTVENMKVAAFFAGIAGFELGLERAGHETVMFCEIDPCARAVLEHHFDLPIASDIRRVRALPRGTELVTAGFPCQDLSQVGSTNGIRGPKSGVVSNLVRLLRNNDVPHVLIENVPFMLHLHQGRAIEYLTKRLESLGYKWAYRVVDARAFGIPQRRERVFLLASKQYDPWRVLFEHSYPPDNRVYLPGIACGFYWTEGTRGLGWAVDSVPPLKGGSSIGISSPPAVWLPDGRIVKPSIRDAERLQGFPADWTLPAEKLKRRGYRWKLVGNAVSVPVAEWLGKCLNNLATIRAMQLPMREHNKKKPWPAAAFGQKGEAIYAVDVTAWPHKTKGKSLETFLKEPEDLSYKAVTGFSRRLTASSLVYPDRFLKALRAHAKRMEGN